jgi:hypothetical protein
MKIFICVFESLIVLRNKLENNHLIEFQLIEIVFYHLIEIMLITWSNFTW